MNRLVCIRSMHHRLRTYLFLHSSIALFYIFGATTLTTIATAQVSRQRPVPIKILGLRVESPTPVDTATVLFYSGLQVGDYLDARGGKIQDAIRSLWKRHEFASVDIVVDKVTLDGTGVYLVIKVRVAGHIRSIQVHGNSAVSTKDILKAFDKREGDAFTPYDLELGRKAVKQLYDKESKPFAKVDVRKEPTDTAHYYTIILDIKESVTFYVNSITFEGAKAFTDAELASAFEDTKTKQWWEIWKNNKFEQKKYEKDRDERLLTFYRKHGYIDAQVVRDSLIFNDSLETVDIRITVDEGRKIYVRNIAFEGNLVFPTFFLEYRLQIQKGDVYNADKFDKNLQGNEDQSDIASLYMNNGYLTARVEKEEKRVAPDSVDITVKIYERNQFTIRRVEIEGNTKTKDKVIRRELFVRPGDYFNRAAIIRSVRFLGQLNYFNPEKLRPDVKLADNTQVDITFKVEERSNDTFNASFGYAGAFGFTGSVGITLNNFSITEPLQGGGGQIFNLNYERGGGFGGATAFGGAGAFNNTFLGGALSTFTLGLTEPWLFDEPTTLGFNIFDVQNFFFSNQRTGASVNIGRRLRWPDDFFRADWVFQGLNNQLLANGGLVINPQQQLFFAQGLEFSISQTISRISIDNGLFPTEGSRFVLSSKISGGALGIGQMDYFRNQLTLESYTPLLQIAEQNRLTLRVNADLGYVTGLNPATELIPPLELYYMGGTVLGGLAITPLRGYPDRMIGPRIPAEGNSQGLNPQGGRAMMLLNAELRFAVTLNPVPIYAMAFVEAGNVWDRITNVNPFDLKRSAGVGVRFLINPIGLLGFDYAYGFDRILGLDGTPVGDSNGTPPGWRFHFQFGR
ncbi:MAG: POTRA domain-containing protein [Bacteroidota bacterium]|nr:BamA/TamA family outer membrane protein [Candidatus Kapabacteria bacterium]MDW8219709.1 POTRA domain-containing protein [Bacteroidota bacterium]